MKKPSPMSKKSVRSTQRLYPLFVASFALVAIGILSAYQSIWEDSEEAAVVVSMPAPFVEVLAEDLQVDDVEPVDFQYKVGPARGVDFVMQQVNTQERAAQQPLTTRLALHWADESSPGEAESTVEITRSFGSTQMNVLEGERQVGPEIVRQLAISLSGARQRITSHERGAVESREWISDTNPQVGKMMHLISDATALVMPRFRREPVNVREEWSYTIPSVVMEPEQAMEATAGIKVTCRFEGVLTREGRLLAVISQRFEAELDARVEDVTMKMAGNGSGLVLFDIDAGAVHRSRLSMTRTSAGSAESAPTQVSEIVLDLTSSVAGSAQAQ